MTNNKKRLAQKIEDLPLKEDLKNNLKQNNITTLQELLAIEVCYWQNKFPGFTNHHQQEIISWLKQNDLIEFLKED